MNDKKQIQIHITNIVQIIRYLRNVEKLSKLEISNLLQTALLIALEDSKDAA